VTRPHEARKSNERIAEQADRFHFVSRVPMLCECSDPACRQIFLIKLERYREICDGGYLTAPEHELDGHARVLEEQDFWQYD